MRKTYLYCICTWFYFICWKSLKKKERERKVLKEFFNAKFWNKVANRKHQPLPPSSVLLGTLASEISSEEAERQAGRTPQRESLREKSLLLRALRFSGHSSPTPASGPGLSQSFGTQLTQHSALSLPSHHFPLPQTNLKLFKTIEKLKEWYDEYSLHLDSLPLNSSLPSYILSTKEVTLLTPWWSWGSAWGQLSSWDPIGCPALGRVVAQVAGPWAFHAWS